MVTLAFYGSRGIVCVGACSRSQKAAFVCQGFTFFDVLASGARYPDLVVFLVKKWSTIILFALRLLLTAEKAEMYYVLSLYHKSVQLCFSPS